MSIRNRAASVILGALGIVALVAGPVFATAFTGIGAGTSTNPYRITTCAQLDEMAGNLAGHYVLNNNINCSGSTFTSIGSLGAPFTGTLDGLNHSIENIDFNGCGIFCAADGATIKNLSISSGTSTVPQHYYHGSFVGFADGTTMTNLHSAVNFTADSYDYVGGIVGFMDNTNTVSASSFTGSIRLTGTDGYAGGITGYLWTSDDSITDSYANATITLASTSSSQSGGEIVGGSYAGTIANTYATGSITNQAASGSFNSVGAFIATASGSTITNSFAATAVSGSDTVGALFGSAGSITTTNVYFDRSAAGTGNCAGSGTVSCAAVNVSNATPAYFFNNTTNQPLNSWSFSTIWTANTTGYPTLRNQSAFTPSGIPNSGDANADGTVDAYQPNVLDIQDGNGVWATVAVASSSNCDLGDGVSTAAGATKALTGYTATTSLTSFRLYCASNGASVPVSIIFDKVYSNPTARYYNATTQTYSIIPGATFTTVTVGGTTKTALTYTLTDGSGLDEDGSANGVIIDPVALFTPISASPAAPDTGYGAAASRTGLYAAYVLFGAGMALVVCVAAFFRRAQHPAA